MDNIINDILIYKNNIESIYLIGSQANNENRYDSDIDLVIIIKKRIPLDWINELKKKHPILDVTILDKKNVAKGIVNSPSIYINAINQIILNKKLLFGNDFVQNLSIPKEHVINNQLYFTLYSYYKLLYQNRINKYSEPLTLIKKGEFLSLSFSKKFKFKESYYFSYKELNTFILTICSYRLIIHNKFESRKAGKNWFLNEYLIKLKDDEYYSFIKEYYEFISEMNSFVFDRESTYLESTEFKTNIYNILLTYLNQLK